MKLAKVRHRILAALVDFGIILGLFVILTIGKLPFIISMLVSSKEHVVTTKFIFDVFRYGIIFCIILLIYYIVFPLFFSGQTIGKKIFKLQIMKDNDKKLDYKTMFYREGIGRIFINIASLGITVIASTIIMALREDNKDLADILAKTKVVDLYESEEN